jgi:hypothetical protein
MKRQGLACSVWFDSAFGSWVGALSGEILLSINFSLNKQQKDKSDLPIETLREVAIKAPRLYCACSSNCCCPKGGCFID